MIGLRRPEPATPPPGEPFGQCQACRRTLSTTALEVRGPASEPYLVCIRPEECRRHWSTEDQPR
jgi:hypothetical protein